MSYEQYHSTLFKAATINPSNSFEQIMLIIVSIRDGLMEMLLNQSVPELTKLNEIQVLHRAYSAVRDAMQCIKPSLQVQVQEPARVIKPAGQVIEAGRNIVTTDRSGGFTRR